MAWEKLVSAAAIRAARGSLANSLDPRTAGNSRHFPPALTQFLKSAVWEQPEDIRGCPFPSLRASPSLSSGSPGIWDVGKMRCQNLKGLKMFLLALFSPSYPNNP